MRVLLFDGQGSAPSSSPHDSLEAPHSPLAALFVSQVHVALKARLSMLSEDFATRLGCHATREVLTDLRSGALRLPISDQSLLQHPLVSLPSLYVAQTIRLLEDLEVETGPLSESPATVIGFSSGLLPALLVASSFPTSGQRSKDLTPQAQITLLRNALALFEVALILGIESEAVKGEMLSASGMTLDDPMREKEWASVVFGETRSDLEERVAEWNSQTSDALHWIHVTAQTTATCHTISGLPHVLRKFTSTVPHKSHLPSITQATFFSPPSPAPSTSSEESNSTMSHVLSRKSSAMSVETAFTSPCQSLRSSSSECELKAPIPVLPLAKDCSSRFATDLGALSNETLCTARQLSCKSLSIHTLFHTRHPSLLEARYRAVSQLFHPSSANYPSSQATSETPTYNTFSHNTLNSSFTNCKDDTRSCLSSIKITGKYAIHDSFTGERFSSSHSGLDLIARVIDLIMLERVEFEQCINSMVNYVSANEEKLELVNYGPGTGLARTAVRALKERLTGTQIAFNDVSSARPVLGCPTKESHEPIAIVGMGVNFPGARNTEDLWRVLEQGINTVEEIPSTRFDISPYTEGSSGNANRKMKTRFGNFLPENLHSGFDASFFHISPREARALDPQMRVLMRVGLQATEAAGLRVAEFSEGDAESDAYVLKSSDVGCFVGVATNDYAHNLRNDLGVHYATGNLPAFLAGRLAYALHISGPSFAVDTACSSSLVAIHQACRALRSGDCKAALAGGVNIISSPDMYIGLDRAHFLSPTGNCKPWDASANGYCRAEGCGMFVFKRLSDALASSDNILGVIRGTEVNQSSAAVSITRPHGPTQMELLKSLLRQTGVAPEEVNVVEAHGTGTQAGDPEEMRTLRDVLSPSNGLRRGATNPLTITGIKANIGHAEAASGAASLAKVLLMLRHRAVPPQISLEKLNPKIECLDKDFTRINTSSSCDDWTPNASGSRLALINNFGAAGSNAALLVEEAPERLSVRKQEIRNATPADDVLITISAETEEALLRLRDSYVLSISDENLIEFAYTASARRQVRPWRMAATASSADACAKALADARPMRFIPEKKATVFVFSGQGGQHIGMGLQIYQTSPFFRACVNKSHKKLLNWGYPGVLAIINAKCEVSDLGKTSELVAFQCAMFVLEMSLYELWKEWGVQPDAVCGHSLGEYAALVAAGVLTHDAGLRLVARRALLMTQHCTPDSTGMLLVRQSAASVADAIAEAELQSTLSIACYNSVKDVVIGGPTVQLEIFKASLERTGVKCFKLPVPFAYHTPAMDPILDELSAFASKFEFSAPTIPILSNVYGCVVRPGEASIFNSGYIAMHCRQPVQFERGMVELTAELESVGTFLELGPHPTTLPMLQSLTSKLETECLHSLNKKHSCRATIFSALSRLFINHNGIAWGRVYRELYGGVTCMEIPGYPLVEKEYWVPYIEGHVGPVAEEAPVDILAKYSFLGSWTQKPSSRDGNISEFETLVEDISDYIIGHNVAGSPLCPASVYCELALSAAKCTIEASEDCSNDALTLSDIVFSQPLVHEGLKPLIIRTTINIHPSGGKHAGTFTISSVFGREEPIVHCTGFYQRREREVVASKLQNHAGNIQRGKDGLFQLTGSGGCETLRTRTIYDLIFPRVVQYSKLYQVIDTMTLDEKNGVALASIHLPEDQFKGRSVSQPVFIDALIHSAGFLINSRATAGDAFICNQIDSSKFSDNIDFTASLEIFCTVSSPNEGSIIADAFAIEKESRRVVAHVKRMRFSRLRLNSLVRALGRSEDFSSRLSSPVSSSKLSMDRPFTPMTPSKLGSPFSLRSLVRSPSCLIKSESSLIEFGAEDADADSDIVQLVAETCGVDVDDISLASRFDELGVDSLGWIELIGQLRESFPYASFGTADLMQCATVGQLLTKVETLSRSISTCDNVSLPSQIRPKLTSISDDTHRLDTMPRLSLPLQASPLAQQVKKILSAVLDVSLDDLDDNSPLEIFGLDSLGSIEVLNELQEWFKIELAADFFAVYKTVGEVQIAILNIVSPIVNEVKSSLRESDNTPTPRHSIRPLLPLQKGDSSSNQMFLVHDGSGLSHCYSHIGPLNRTIWGLNNPKLFSGERWLGGISEMAAHYVSEILPLMTDAGCVLGGWSFGGVVAFEMASRLMREGVKVAGVVLIDSPSPFTTNTLSEHLIDTVIGSSAQAVNDQEPKVLKLARQQMAYATQALVSYDPMDALPSLEMPKVVMLRCTEPFTLPNSEKLGCSFDPFLEDRSDPKALVEDWERLTGREVPVLDIPGHHFGPFATKNVAEVTRQLSNAVSILEGSKIA